MGRMTGRRLGALLTALVVCFAAPAVGKDDSVEQLIQALESKDAATRAAAAKRLGEMADKAPWDYFCDNECMRPKEETGTALGIANRVESWQGPVRAALQQVLYEDENPIVRGEAALALGYIPWGGYDPEKTKEERDPYVLLRLAATSARRWKIPGLAQEFPSEGHSSTGMDLNDLEKGHSAGSGQQMDKQPPRLLERALDQEVTEELIKGLCCDDPEAMAIVASLISKMPGKDAKPFLERAMAKGGEAARIWSAGGLYRLGDKSGVDIILAGLKSADPENRKIAARFLADLKLPEKLEAALAACNDPDEQVRGYAIWSLGEYKSEDSPVIKAMEDGSVYIRRAASKALMKSQNKLAAKAMTAALRDEDPAVRYNAAWYFCSVAAKSAVSNLLTALRDTEESIAQVAAQALVKQQDKSAAIGMAEALKSGYIKHIGFMYSSLHELAGPSLIPTIATLLNNPNFKIRAGAVGTIRSIGGARVEKVLIRALKDEHPQVQIIAAGAFVEMGKGEIAAPALKEAIYKLENERKLGKDWGIYVGKGYPANRHVNNARALLKNIKGYKEEKSKSAVIGREEVILPAVMDDTQAMLLMQKLVLSDYLYRGVEIADELRRGGNRSIIPALRAATQNANLPSREPVMLALAALDDQTPPEIHESLINLIADDGYDNYFHHKDYSVYVTPVYGADRKPGESATAGANLAQAQWRYRLLDQLCDYSRPYTQVFTLLRERRVFTGDYAPHLQACGPSHQAHVHYLAALSAGLAGDQRSRVKHADQALALADGKVDTAICILSLWEKVEGLMAEGSKKEALAAALEAEKLLDHIARVEIDTYRTDFKGGTIKLKEKIQASKK